MNPADEIRQQLTRRSFLGSTARGIGGVALASLLNPNLLLAAEAASGAAGKPGVMPLVSKGMINP
ncbi:MAG TPA: hypothetical protein VF669_07630, partial [Tepidisphaeraceae bacterium]